MSRSFEKTISPFSEDLETVLGKQVTKSHWHATAYVAAARPKWKSGGQDLLYFARPNNSPDRGVSSFREPAE